jgi:hypothetical protein
MKIKIVCLCVLMGSFLMFADNSSIKIGWAEANITPDEPVLLQGQFHARVSEGVKNPIMATVMALESTASGAPEALLMISCDLISITEGMSEAVQQEVQKIIPEISANSIIMNATHTHTAPTTNDRARYQENPTIVDHPYGIELPAMPPTRYIAFAASRIAATAAEAWKARRFSGVAYGLGHATVGRNRLISYHSGKSRMYGRSSDPDFSHIEGYEDHALNILGTYDLNGKLSGLIVNFACPAQTREQDWQISADYWHELRQELRQRFKVFVLPQVSAAGDQSPHSHFLPDAYAEIRMRQLAGISLQQDIALRVANEIGRLLPLIEKEINWTPVVYHHYEKVPLPRRIIPEEDVEKALAESLKYKEEYEQLMEKLASDPTLKQVPRWYTEITTLRSRYMRGKRVQQRFLTQKTSKTINFGMHALRIGDIIIVTNPFELYLDFGMQIKAASPAVQTFVVQLAGPGSYLPTARSIAGGAYGAVPASTEIGADGGKVLVDWTVRTCQEIWLKTSPQNKVPLLPEDFSRIPPGAGLDQMLTMPIAWTDSAEPISNRAVAGFGHTASQLFITAVVEDQVHANQSPGTSLWNGDALQMQLVSGQNREVLHAILALTPAGSQIQRFDNNVDSLQPDFFQVTRDENNKKTYYQITLSLEAIGLNTKDKSSFRFNCGIFNTDSETSGQDGKWLQITPGLLGYRNTWSFKTFTIF